MGAVSIITGDVGSGKSTALRYAAGKLHPSRYKVVSIVAVTGSIADIMRQLCNGFDVEGHSNSLAKLTRTASALRLGVAFSPASRPGSNLGLWTFTAT